MTKNTSGNSRHKAGDDRPRRLRRIEHWSELRGRTLRLFVRELIAAHKLRGAEAMTGLSKEALRKIADGRSSRPNLSTRQTLGMLFLRLYPEGTLFYLDRESARVRPRLIDGLPEGEESATAAIERFVALACRGPAEAPAFADSLRAWMLDQVRAEYEGHRRVFGERSVHPLPPAGGTEDAEGG